MALSLAVTNIFKTCPFLHKSFKFFGHLLKYLDLISSRILWRLFHLYVMDKVASQIALDDESFTRNITMDESSLSSAPWSWYKEKVGVWGNSSFEASGLLEQINTTKDTSDFLWYTIR